MTAKVVVMIAYRANEWNAATYVRMCEYFVVIILGIIGRTTFAEDVFISTRILPFFVHVFVEISARLHVRATIAKNNGF